eukprot:CAMPEP_0202923740 /NCGR_PEP_ID=MMETSP1392-20130828/78610_1 /ASSEMBLY_ACC=CAM_ASM_000868 /TAXON_ID=225041 /ORGANISM="Chlamydomonas chlamydogama, Strain SAG 11-48b" /LENGTH=104 /DNA_ID=CAMNT_0049617439 /DNA_START=1048 /DNA_END=1362 /DNA_ORIENTATION=-
MPPMAAASSAASSSSSASCRKSVTLALKMRPSAVTRRAGGPAPRPYMPSASEPVWMRPNSSTAHASSVAPVPTSVPRSFCSTGLVSYMPSKRSRVSTSGGFTKV